jgi:hypothetical protein
VPTLVRACFSPVLALLLTGCGSKQAAERVYVPGVYGSSYGLRYQPTRIIYTGDGSSYVNHLRYRSYGGARAIAVGIDQVDDCKPSCGGGTYYPVPARVTLSHLAQCRGKRIYAVFKIDAPGARRYNKINPFTVDLRYMAACPAP